MEINKKINSMELFYNKKWFVVNTNVWDDNIEFSYDDMVFKPLGRLRVRKYSFNVFSNVIYKHTEIACFSHEDFYKKLKKGTLKVVDLFYCVEGPSELRGKIVIPNNTGFFTLNEKKVRLEMC